MTTDADRPGPAAPGADPAALLETMAVGYVRLDRDWRMTTVNLAAERVLGRRAGDLVGRSMWDEFPGARELEFGRVYEAVMDTRVAQTAEAFYPGLDTWFELRIEPVADGGIALYFLDVTARRRGAERLALLARQHATAAAVSAALTADLDVVANVGALARLVLPELGTWSVVSLVGDDGTLVDAGTWHVEPDRRDIVARFARARVPVIPREDSLAGRAVRERTVVAHSDMGRRIGQMPHDEARELLTELAPAAVLNVPMVARGRTVGLISVFAELVHTPEQVTLARDIADRAALAIDNSASYARARTARAEAEAAGRRLALLAQAGEMLGTGDDLQAAVGRLAQLVVPQLADWSIVTVVDPEGVPRDPGWAHHDAALVPDVAAYAAHRSAAMTADSPLATVLRTGEAVILPDVTSELVAAAVGGDEVVARLADVLAPHSAVLAPLASHGRVFGVLTVVTTRARGSHTAAQIQTVLEVAARAGTALDRAWSAGRAKGLAESVQRSMLTVAAPGAGVQVATRYRPADVDRQVGGDWYDTFRRDDGATVVTIGDVMGHDVAAISSMAQLRTIMRASAWSLDRSPADVLRTTDEISAALGPGTYATVVTAHVTPTEGGAASLRWASAGHLPPAVLGPDGVVTLLRPERVEPPLGVRPDVVRSTHETRIAPGSTIVLYTDGLIERRGEDLETRLLELARVLRDLGGESLEAVLDKLLTDLAGVDQRDDVALLALRIGSD